MPQVAPTLRHICFPDPASYPWYPCFSLHSGNAPVLICVTSTLEEGAVALLWSKENWQSRLRMTVVAMVPLAVARRHSAG